MEVNNMKTIIQNSILACLAFCMGTACTKESGMEETSHGKGYLEVFATIGKASTAPTRADGDTENKADAYGVPMDPLYSYLSTGDGGGFQNNGKCKIGIYSLNGTDGTSTNPLVSTPLTYTEGSFVNEEIEISSMTNLGPTFAYYPYSAVNEQATNQNTDGPLKYELDIYTKDDSNNPYTTENKNQVIDLLTASNSGSLSGGKISYSFSHACSMLLIYRGEGFDQKDTEVTVKIEQGLKAYVYRGTSGNFSLTIGPDKTATARTEFATNYCSSYLMEGSEKARPVYSVILPPGATVEYIKLEDNFGTMQYVYPEETMTLDKGTRYPVTVKLDGLYPTIYPHNIVAWDDEAITIDQKDKNPGIYSINDFNAWITAYTAQNKTELVKYGKKENDQSPWTFHLYADINCSTITDKQFFIKTFTDQLEGHGHTLKNVTLTKAEGETDTNIGVIGTLNGGSINNLKIDSITVSGETIENDYIGTLVGTITDGSITKCKITGINIDCENGKVGALAGKIETGTIETCLLEGNLQLGKEAITAENSKKLFGEMGTFNFNTDATDINTSGVYVFRATTDNPVSGGSDDGTDTGSGDGTNTGSSDGTDIGSGDGTDTGNNTGNEGNTDGGGN